MINVIFNTAASALLLGAMQVSAAGSSSSWSYEGNVGPESWGDISPDFQACSKGRNQSPIDIVLGIEAALPELVFDYQPSPLHAINNGHTIQQNIQPGSTIKIPSRDKKYELKQFQWIAHHPTLLRGRCMDCAQNTYRGLRSTNLPV